MGKSLSAVLLLALLVRGGVLWLTPDALVADRDDYRRLAENIVEQGTFGEGATPTAFRPPLYPLLLTGCVVMGDYCRLGVGVLHVVLGTAAVGLVFVLGNWWGLGRRGAAVAALLVACDPILMHWSTRVMTETAATFLAVGGLLALTCSRHTPCAVADGTRSVPATMLAGAVLAAGALCRPTLLPWTIAAGVVLWLQQNNNYNSRGLTAPEGIAKKLRLPAAFALGAAVVLGPWTIRNQLQFGRPIVTTTHGGYTLLLANNPEFYGWLRSGRWGSVWRADEFNADWRQRRPGNELDADRLAYAEAWRTIRREPGTFAYSSLVRLGRFWSPLPHRIVAHESLARRLARWAVAVWYVLEFMLAAVGVWRISTFRPPPSALRPPPLFWGLLLVACLTGVHAVFWTDMRMRAVVMPVVALAAAAGLSHSFSGRRPPLRGGARGDLESPPAPAARDRGPLV